MDKKQIQDVLGYDEPSRLKQLEKKLEETFHQSFVCFYNGMWSLQMFLLYVEREDDLIEICFTIYPSGIQSLVGSVVSPNEDKMVYHVSSREIITENKKTSAITRVFLSEIKEENKIRLLVATGVIEINEELI